MLLRSIGLILLLACVSSCSEDAGSQLEGNWRMDAKLTRSSREFKALSMERREAMRGKFKDFPARLSVDGNRLRLGDDRWTFNITSDNDGELNLELTDSEGVRSTMVLRLRKDRLYLVDAERPLAFIRDY